MSSLARKLLLGLTLCALSSACTRAADEVSVDAEQELAAAPPTWLVGSWELLLAPEEATPAPTEEERELLQLLDDALSLTITFAPDGTLTRTGRSSEATGVTHELTRRGSWQVLAQDENGARVTLLQHLEALPAEELVISLAESGHLVMERNDRRLLLRRLAEGEASQPAPEVLPQPPADTEDADAPSPAP